MKNKSFIIAGLLLLGLGTVLPSCNKLDYEPENSLTPEAAIKDALTARSAITGLYGTLQGVGENAGDYSFDIIAMPGCFSDEATWTGTFPTRQEYSSFNLTTPNGNNAGIYEGYYTIIRGTNDVIARIEKVTDPSLTDELKKHLEAEAKFLRAYAYFFLTNFYGNIPLVLEATNSDNLQEQNDMPNATKADIWAQIEADLKYALENFDDAESGGAASRASSWAIKALTARVKLYQNKWEEARTLAEDVINNSPFVFSPSYSGIFGVAGKNSRENIWYINYNEANSSAVAFYFLPSSAGGRNEVSVRNPDMFDSTDLRGPESIQGDIVYKYRDVATGTDPLILLRMGEMYLIAAETEARAGNFSVADEYINEIRKRAGLKPLALDADNYLDLILNERKLELCFEPGAHRLFDLRRTGKAVEVLGDLGYDEPKDNLWPFPQRETDANHNLVQNTGY